jgi:outer membrane receptor protein involved in Fe transport
MAAFGFTRSSTTQCDQFHQHDDRLIYGGQANHTWFGKVAGLEMDNTIGLQIRSDVIRNLALSHTVQRQEILNIRTDHIDELATGLYFQNGTRWLEKFRTVLGLRGDIYHFKVDSDLPQNSGTETSTIFEPKLSTIFGPWSKTEFYASVGRGFHSNDARGTTITLDPSDKTLSTPADKVSPLVHTLGYEVGARTAVIPHLQSELALWYLKIGSELLFVGDGGATEPSFPTKRYGVEWANYYTPTPWMTIDGDFAYSHARFEDNPAGDRIPNALEYVITSGITIDRLNGPFGSLRYRYFSTMPLVEDNSLRGRISSIVDLQAGYEVTQNLRFLIEVFNLLNSEANDIQYGYPSCLNNELTGDHCDAVDNGDNTIHIHPTEPTGVRFGMVYNF